MIRPLRSPWTWMLLAGSLGIAAPALGQYHYPPGYGRYGWSGWNRPAAAGVRAAGMGNFAAGAGQYNVQTAQARQMNAQTVEQFNDYMWQTQRERNQEYSQRLAADAKQDKVTFNAAQDRILNNPNQHDLESGDTLNAIYIELTAPKAYGRTLQAANQPLAGTAVRNIPFVFASSALSYTLAQLTSAETVPPIFADPAFRQTRQELRTLADDLLKQTAGSKPPAPETLKKFRAGLDTARKTLEGMTKPDSDQRRDGENYLKALYGVSRMLEAPNYGDLLKSAAEHPTVPLRDVLSFMHAFNLQFGPAKTPEQREIYSQLYGMLSDLRGGGGTPTAPPDPRAQAGAGQQPDSRITNFFAGMDYDHFNPSASPPPPPPAFRP